MPFITRARWHGSLALKLKNQQNTHMKYIHPGPKPLSHDAAPLDVLGLEKAQLLLTGESGAVALGFDPESPTLPYVSAFARGADASILIAQAEMLGLPVWEASNLVTHILSCNLEAGHPIPSDTYSAVGAWLVLHDLFESCDIRGMFVFKDVLRRPAIRN
jgi:type III secretion system FlhB-like substrate exporter